MALRFIRRHLKGCPHWSLRALFRFCHQSGWIKQNPALAVKPPKVTPAPTLPFSREEMKRIIEACDKYGGNQERMTAFVLMMRYTGPRIGEAIRLQRRRCRAARCS
jgi:site-specific recombinase XerD